MSRRNSLAVKATRRAARASGSTPSRARIAEALHQAVCEVTGTDGFLQCVDYAWSGAYIAGIITGRPHHMQAGSAYVYCSPADDDGPGVLAGCWARRRRVHQRQQR